MKLLLKEFYDLKPNEWKKIASEEIYLGDVELHDTDGTKIDLIEQRDINFRTPPLKELFYQDKNGIIHCLQYEWDWLDKSANMRLFNQEKKNEL